MTLKRNRLPRDSLMSRCSKEGLRNSESLRPTVYRSLANRPWLAKVPPVGLPLLPP